MAPPNTVDPPFGHRRCSRRSQMSPQQLLHEGLGEMIIEKGKTVKGENATSSADAQPFPSQQRLLHAADNAAEKTIQNANSAAEEPLQGTSDAAAQTDDTAKKPTPTNVVEQPTTESVSNMPPPIVVVQETDRNSPELPQFSSTKAFSALTSTLGSERLTSTDVQLPRDVLPSTGSEPKPPVSQPSLFKITSSRLPVITSSPAVPGPIFYSTPPQRVGPSQPPAQHSGHGSLNEEFVPSILSWDSYDEEHEVANPNQREGKAPESGFYIYTTSGVQITADADPEDPDIIEGILNSTTLPKHKSYYDTVPGDLISLMKMGIRDSYYSLIHFIRAKREMGNIFADAGSSADLHKVIAELEKAKEQNAAQQHIIDVQQAQISRLQVPEGYHKMEAELQHAKEQIATQQNTISQLQSQIAFFSYKISEARADRLEGDLNKLQKESQEKITYLQNELTRTRQANNDLLVFNADKSMAFTPLEQKLSNLEEAYVVGNRRYQSLVRILAAIRKRFNEVCVELNEMSVRNAVLLERSLKSEGAAEKNALLELELATLRVHLLTKTQQLAQILAEAGRVDLIPANTHRDDPRNLRLQVWQAEEVLLRQAIQDAENNVQGQLLDKLGEIESSYATRQHEERTAAYVQGRRDGRHDSIVDAIFDKLTLSGVNQEIDKILDDTIAALEAEDPTLRDSLLIELRTARAASRSGFQAHFFGPGDRLLT